MIERNVRIKAEVVSRDEILDHARTYQEQAFHILDKEKTDETADREMKEHPGRFVPTAAGELIDRSAPGTLIPAPRYSPEDLGKSISGFTIDRARLLSNGMQEFLFRLGP